MYSIKACHTWLGKRMQPQFVAHKTLIVFEPSLQTFFQPQTVFYQQHLGSVHDHPVINFDHVMHVYNYVYVYKQSLCMYIIHLN